MNTLNSNFLKSILDHAQIGYAVCNVQTSRIEMINPVYASICGYDTTDSCQCIFYTDKCNGAMTDSMCSIYNMPIEMELTKRDGSITPIEAYISIFKDHEGVEYRLINVVDISKRKLYEKELLEREQSYRALVEFSPDMIARYDHEARLLYANPALYELLVRSSDEVIGRMPSNLIHSPSSFEYEKVIKRVFETVVPEDFEYSFIDVSTGKNLVHVVRLVPELVSETGIPKYVIGIGRDITSLIEQQTCLEEAQMIAKLGNWELKYPERSLYCSKEIFRIFEMDTDNSPDFQTFFSCIHPDDRDLVIECLNSSIMNKTPFDIVHRLLFNDGLLKYVQQRGESFYDNVGKPLRIVGTTQDITKQKIAETKIEHMAFYDTLTGLPNRSMAKKLIEPLFRVASSESKIAILFIDLDGFKTINDTFGHSVGDAVLKSVATKFHCVLRSSDIVYRLGGDEFVLVISGIDNDVNIQKIVQKIFDEFQTPCQVSEDNFLVTMSIGIALYSDHGDSFESLLQKADMAMYKAKESGKNGYSFYSEEMNHHYQILNELREALDEKQFILHYQPQIDIASNTIVGAEALIRWKHPVLGMVPPIQFIPVAEHNGLMVSIGEWVIREACRQVNVWLSRGIKLTVAVNVSSLQFKRGSLRDIVMNGLNEFGVPPYLLELELTESIIMNDSDDLLEEIKNIKNLGVKLSIDDFGTGYSSLAYLKRFAVDKLKIDHSFIRELLNNQEDDVIVKTIIQMAKSLNLKTIAEGVECTEVLDLLIHYGCDEVQGYHFSKPMDSKEFEDYYRVYSAQKYL